MLNVKIFFKKSKHLQKKYIHFLKKISKKITFKRKIQIKKLVNSNQLRKNQNKLIENLGQEKKKICKNHIHNKL